MVSHIINKRRYEKRGKQDERKSSEEISDGGNVCGLGDRSSDGIPYVSECGKYFFSPMHIPVLICGLLCGWQYGLICGILALYYPVCLQECLRLQILPAMLCELAVYGLITGICVYGIHTEKQIVKSIWFADHSDAGRENCQRYFKSTYFQCGRI